MRRNRWLRIYALVLAGLFCGVSCDFVQQPRPGSPKALLVATLDKVASIVEPDTHSPAQTFTAHYKVVKGEGVSKKLLDTQIELAVQAPDRLHVAAPVSGKNFELGRNGQQLWFYARDKQFCLVGQPGIARFRSAPDSLDTTEMRPFSLPFSRAKIASLARFLNVERKTDASIGTNLCYVLKVTPKYIAVKARRLPAGGQLELWVRQADLLPQRISYSDARGVHVTVEADQLEFQEPWPAEKWSFVAGQEDRTENVALSHLTQFLSARWSLLKEKIPSLGPPDGERRVVAREGRGRLEMIDGTNVLFVAGSPEEMGRQHGVLLQKQVQHTVQHMLYGAGIGSSLAKGTWFFGQMDAATQRLLPHMDQMYVREMDAMAVAAGVTKEEMRLANFFPELFHCSGFAIFGDATAGGRMYHGRILDYFRGMGLEQNAVVIVSQPDYGNAWVNISYAGFVGSVTAMNEKHIAIGEMGGGGEGQWDGKPMAQLVREAMEKADSIEEAVEIFRRGPRTCEYYYVISDGKSKRAVGIRATPTEFETVWAGERHALVPQPIKDAVIVSGGDRITELTRRINAGFGRFDATSARELMSRPVCMSSNIHSVLFAPETLDFWVANADSENVASHTRFTHYNLAELLKRPAQKLAGAFK